MDDPTQAPPPQGPPATSPPTVDSSQAPVLPPLSRAKGPAGPPSAPRPPGITPVPEHARNGHAVGQPPPFTGPAPVGQDPRLPGAEQPRALPSPLAVGAAFATVPTIPDLVQSSKRPVEPAGFWPRFLGHTVDYLILGLGLRIIAFGGTFVVLLGVVAAGWVGLAISVALVIAACVYFYYRLIVRPLSESGGTIGMRFAGVQILGADDEMFISRRRSLARCVVAFACTTVSVIVTLPIQSLILSPFIEYSVGDYGQLGLVGWVLSILLSWAAFGLPALWSLISKRRQTPWDLATETIVIKKPL